MLTNEHGLSQVIAVCKSADMLIMVLDAGKPHSHREILTRELEAVGIRLNRDPPEIYVKPKKTGGISFNSTAPLTHLDDKMVFRVLQEYKMHNAEILFKCDATVDDLIDVMEVRSTLTSTQYVDDIVNMFSSSMFTAYIVRITVPQKTFYV